MRLPTLKGLAALLLGQPALSEQLMRALALKGELPQFLDSDYQPGITCLDLTADEFNWARRMTRLDVGVNGAAVAAQFCIISFGGQQFTRSMAIVDAVVISNTSGATALFQYGINFVAPGFALSSLGTMNDDRMFPFTRGAYSAGTGNNAVNPLTGAGAAVVSIPAGQSFVVPRKFILTQKDNAINGSALHVVNTTVNATMAVAFHWRERETMASEL